MNIKCYIPIFLSYCISNLAFANSNTSTQDQNAILACMSILLKTADKKTSVEELQKQCKQQIKSPIRKRITFEKQAADNPFSILPHKPNYILPFTYFEANETPYKDLLQGYSFDDIEVKFQVSDLVNPIRPL